MDGIAVRPVRLAELVVKGHDHLLVRIVGGDVLLCVPHAVLGAEGSSVEVAFVGIEAEYLVIENRVFGGFAVFAFP